MHESIHGFVIMSVVGRGEETTVNRPPLCAGHSYCGLASIN